MAERMRFPVFSSLWSYVIIEWYLRFMFYEIGYEEFIRTCERSGKGCLVERMCRNWEQTTVKLLPEGFEITKRRMNGDRFSFLWLSPSREMQVTFIIIVQIFIVGSYDNNFSL
jgi:hypothetical protein